MTAIKSDQFNLRVNRVSFALSGSLLLSFPPFSPRPRLLSSVLSMALLPVSCRLSLLYHRLHLFLEILENTSEMFRKAWRWRSSLPGIADPGKCFAKSHRIAFQRRTELFPKISQSWIAKWCRIGPQSRIELDSALKHHLNGAYRYELVLNLSPICPRSPSIGLQSCPTSFDQGRLQTG